MGTRNAGSQRLALCLSLGHPSGLVRDPILDSDLSHLQPRSVNDMNIQPRIVFQLQTAFHSLAPKPNLELSSPSTLFPIGLSGSLPQTI